MHSLNKAKRGSTRACRNARGSPFALAALGLPALAPMSVNAQEVSDKWQFAVAVYGWLPEIAGDTSFPTPGGGDIEVDPNTILDNLEMAALASFSLQKGRWGTYTDLIYLNVGDSKSQTRDFAIGGTPLPATLTATARFDLKSTIWTIGMSYRMTGNDAATFDVLAGARLAAMKPELSWEFTGDFGPVVPPPRTGRSEQSVDQWDGIVGVKGYVAFGAKRKWLVPYYFDIGAGDSDLTWQALLGLGYAFGWGDVDVAWRYLDYELKTGAPVADMRFSGPALGAIFRW